MKNFGSWLFRGFVATLLLAGSAYAGTLLLDNFQQFPAGTVLSPTNYFPNVGVLATITNENGGDNSTTVVATNFPGSTLALFEQGTLPYQENYEGALADAPTDQVVTLSFTLWIPTVQTTGHFGGLGPLFPTTAGNDGLLVWFNDDGNVVAFTNEVSGGQLGLPFPFVQIGNWSALAGTIMTNTLVVNYPAGTFSFSLNGAVLTNMPIPVFLTNYLDKVRVVAFEGNTNAGVASLGNSFALGNVLLSVPSNSTNQDVSQYAPGAKGQLFDQFTAGAPTLSVTGFMYQASVTGTGSNTILSATVQVPGGSNIVLSLTDPASSKFKFQSLFTDQPSLDAVFTNGTYLLIIGTTDDGTLTPSLDLSGDDYPSPPQVLNFDAAQVIEPSTNFVFVWGSFTNGTTNDVVDFEIDDGSGNTITNTPDFGQPGQLDGTATNFLVPAGLLTGGTTNTGHLEFIKVIASDTNSVPGAFGLTGYFAETQFSIVVGTTVCAFVISPTNVIFTAAGGDGGVIVTVLNGCNWTATNNDSFITINSGTSGSGNGMVSYTIAPNTNDDEITGTMTIAGQTFTVVQTGLDCTFLLDSTSASYDATGGSSNIVVTAGTNCDWMAASNSSFITITGGSSGLGNGSVSYTVAANISSNDLTGTITVAGQIYTITEAGVTCAFSLDSTNADFDLTGGSSNIVVTANGTNCAWTAVSNSGFITIDSGSSGTGSGSVGYTVASNVDAIVQTGSLTVAGQIYTITQAAAPCSFSLDFTNADLDATGASGDITFTANGTNCAWTAVSNDSFITITNGPSGTSGTGNGTVTVTVATNTDTVARTGTLTIAGQTFTVNEDAAACALTLDSISADFSAAGGSSNVAVIANGTNCDWTAASNTNLITITAGTNGLGNGTVSYTVAANTGTARTVTMTIADQTFVVHQAGATLGFAFTQVAQTCKTKIVKKKSTTNTTCAVDFDLVVTNTGVEITPKFVVLFWLGQGHDFNPHAGIAFQAKKVNTLKENKSVTFKIKKTKINGNQAGTFFFATDTADNVLASAEIPSP